MTIRIPNDVLSLMQKLKAAGYEAYVVGGAVRDSILGISPKDWDLTTNAKPGEIEEVFKDFLVIETGIKHGTVTVVLNNENYEITTYRIDGDYSDGRHPDSVKFTDSLKEDLSRRDLTINALAADIDGEIVDYFNGLDDIKNKIIRTVGNPYDRFSEDALRIFRVFRFATKYRSSISSETIEAINKFVFDSTTLPKISSERISAEFRKAIENYDSSAFNNIIAMLEIIYNFIIKTDDSNYGLSKDTIDFFKLIEGKIISNDYISYNAIGASASFSVKIAALFVDSIECTHDGIRFYIHPNTKNGFYVSFNNSHLTYPKKLVDELLRNFFKFTSKEVKEIEAILDTVIIVRETKDLDYIAVKKIMSDVKSKKYNLDICYFALKLCGVSDCESSYRCSIAQAFYNIILDKNEPLTISDLAIDGNDVIRITQCSGKDVGKNLSLCLDSALEYPEKNTKEELTKILLSAKEEN